MHDLLAHGFQNRLCRRERFGVTTAMNVSVAPLAPPCRQDTGASTESTVDLPASAWA